MKTSVESVPFFLAAGVLAVALVSAAPRALGGGPQDPPPRPEATPPKGDATGQPGEGEERDIFGRDVTAAPTQSLRKRLNGCWQLLDVELRGFPEVGRAGSGFMLIRDGFVALELHLTWSSEVGRPDMHQTFLGEFTLDQDGSMRTSTLIGSFLHDSTGQLEWERSGLEREYQVTLTDRLLVLQFGAGNRMSFVPRRATRPTELDIFGREVEASGDERDIFGRPAPERAPDEEERESPKPAPLPKKPGGEEAR